FRRTRPGKHHQPPVLPLHTPLHRPADNPVVLRQRGFHGLKFIFLRVHRAAWQVHRFAENLKRLPRPSPPQQFLRGNRRVDVAFLADRISQRNPSPASSAPAPQSGAGLPHSTPPAKLYPPAYPHPPDAAHTSDSAAPPPETTASPSTTHPTPACPCSSRIPHPSPPASRHASQWPPDTPRQTTAPDCATHTPSPGSPEHPPPTVSPR